MNIKEKVQAAKQALKDAKTELLAVAQRAVDDLNEVGEELGFRYELTDVSKKQDAEATTSSAKPAPKTERNRRSDTEIDTIKQNILAHIKTAEDGMTARQVFTKFNVSEKDEQNYSNYIKALCGDAKKPDSHYLKKITLKSDGSNLAKSAIKYKWLKDMAKAT